jgi:hypothetical protein
MEPHDSRNLDPVIDGVARAMTNAPLPRDLRPAIASRLASRPSWAPAWRLTTATAALAAIVLVAVVFRGERAPRPGSVMDAEAPRAAVAPPAVVAERSTPSLSQSSELPRPRAGARVARVAVSRQARVAAAGSADGVDIRPLAIDPVEADPLMPLEAVEITPIDVEPLRITQLELVE